MKMPTSNIGRFWFYFVIQFTSYALVVANGRAYVLGDYMWTAVTDGPSLAGYVIGGTLGSLFAIWLTKMVYGQ